MDGITFLIILGIICIVAIIFIFIFQTYNFISLKSYREKWEPIYENRKEHFDIYLKEALYICNENDSIEIIAGVAAINKFQDTNDSSINLDKLKEYYICELRSANIG